MEKSNVVMNNNQTIHMFTGNGYRISFLTSRLVRFEYQQDNHFVDSPTVTVQNRTFPPVQVIARQGHNAIELDTEYLHIVYDGQLFSKNGLSISVKGKNTAYQSTWRYGESFSTLGGTLRTLDGTDGCVPVEEGLISKYGFSLLDDSHGMILDANGKFSPREYNEIDFYFWGYGHDYQQCLKDFYKLSGSVPLFPRYALGNWWSRFFAYSEDTYLSLIDRFEKEKVPLSVAVIDMDWHLTDVPHGSGWTGYTWNKKLFPNPVRFLDALHQKNLHITLNLHPAGGVEPHEEAYPLMCKALEKNIESNLRIDFDVTDERFLQAYFDFLHHPHEDEGVDFWWIDWQQGKESAITGLDPLWVLNERHFLDIQRNGKRGLILSRYAGPGSHRTPVGFSGDTVMSWASLAFQPEFTAMASNAGYPWWSHDIGGHMGGVRSDELSVRWLQYGVFSPILRLHSGKMAFNSKEPWTYGREACRIMCDYLRLRHRLIPYLYTAAERTHRLGEALIRPIYHEWPEKEEAYLVNHQYLFGQSMIVCPITQPLNPDLQMAKTTAWLPSGIWFDFMTGQMYSGGRMLNLWRPLEAYPVFSPAGAIIPLSDSLQAEDNPAELTLCIFGGASGNFDLYEDDGISVNSPTVFTHISMDWNEGAIIIKPEGDFSLLPSKRIWHFECFGFSPKNVKYRNETINTKYDQERNVLCFTITEATDISFVIHFSDMQLLQDNWLKRAEKILQRAQTSNDEKEFIWRLLNEHGNTTSVMGTLQARSINPALLDSLAESMFSIE